MTALSFIHAAVFMMLAPYLLLVPDIIFLMVMPATVFVTSLGVMNLAFYVCRRLYTELSGKGTGKKAAPVQTPASVSSPQSSQGAAGGSAEGSPQKVRKMATSGSSTLPPASPGGGGKKIWKRILVVGVKLPFI
jgi:hypothetical protein